MRLWHGEHLEAINMSLQLILNPSKFEIRGSASCKDKGRIFNSIFLVQKVGQIPLLKVTILISSALHLQIHQDQSLHIHPGILQSPVA